MLIYSASVLSAIDAGEFIASCVGELRHMVPALTDNTQSISLFWTCEVM